MHSHGGAYNSHNRERASDGNRYMRDLMASTYERDFPDRRPPKPNISHPHDGYRQPSVMLREQSTHREDFQAWKPQDPGPPIDKITVVNARFNTSSEYQDHFHNHHVRSHIHERPRDAVPSSTPLNASSIYRESFSPQPDRGYQNVIPAQNFRFAPYRAFGSTYGTDFKDSPGRRRPASGHPADSFQQPDFRTFETESRKNFQGTPGGPACDLFVPNPPVIPQPFVEESVTPHTQPY